MAKLKFESSWVLGTTVELGEVMNLRVPALELTIANGENSTFSHITEYEAEMLMTHLKEQFPNLKDL